MKNQVKFKVGDLVYVPHLTNEIVKLKYSPEYERVRYSNNGESLPFAMFEFTYSPFGKSSGHKYLCYLNRKGCASTHQNPVIFHATQENYELLCKLYPNVSFEPPKQKEPKDVIQAIINSNHKFIACINKSVDVEKHPLDGMGVFSTHTLKTINYEKLIGELVPFDLETGKVIVDFVDGKPVLESGNDE